MRTFAAGDGRVNALAYSPDSRFLIVDIREMPSRHPWMGFNCHPGRELVWWDWGAGTVHRRFRLRDSLYGEGGALADRGRGDWSPDSPALEVSFCVKPWRVA